MGQKPVNQKCHFRVRKKKYFMAGEVSWNQGTLINILSKNTSKKTPQRKIWEFFLLDILETTP